jgi:hypothetical protein
VRVFTTGLLAATIAVTGCGSSSTNGVSQADVQAYAALAQQVGSSAAAYGTAASATVDVSSCQSTHTSYDGQVHPMLDRLRSMSGGMDQQMDAMGRAVDGDLSCGADALTAELDHHDAVACTSTSMSANYVEDARHVSAMTAWAAHQQARADEMGGMMGMGMMGGTAGTSTMTCHRNADGTFTLGP